MRSLSVFMFHDIRDHFDIKHSRRYNLKSFLSIKQFVDYINYIVSRFKVISTEQLSSGDITGGNDDCAILTFDDGLIDHYNNVLPILKHYKIKGTFLIASKPATESYIIHSHKIQFIISCVADESLLVKRIFDELGVDNEEQVYLWEKYSISNHNGNWWTKEMVFITNFFRNYKDRYPIVDTLFSELVASDFKRFNESFYLKPEHVTKLVKAGMDIGGHGHTSENLLLLDDIGVREDVSKSIAFVKGLSKSSITSFSYPNGGYNKKIIDILAISSCDVAFTTEEKTISQLTPINYLCVPRFNLLGARNT